jgi:cytochrome c-type biogenesis protein CcmH
MRRFYYEYVNIITHGTAHMKKRTFFVIFGLILMMSGLLLPGVHPAAAQNPKPTPSDDEVNRVAKQMYCPVCENIPLDVCPTQACHDWRELIRQKLADGWTDQQIKDYFAQQYGVRVLAEPPASGLNWLVYILPWVAFLAGVVIVWRVLVSVRKKPTAAGAADSTIAKGTDDPYLSKLEEELKKKE